MTTQVTGSGVNFNGATSGTILLTQPAVAGTNTITFPAETGTLRSTVSSGTVLQVVEHQIGTVATGTTVSPLDDSIPQITEGNEYMSLAITPESATSKLVISAKCFLATNSSVAGQSGLTAALFQDATAGALAAATIVPFTTGAVVQLVINYVMTSGTTSATTFRVRGGFGTAATTTFNGTGGGRLLGGVMYSSITIWEVIP